MNKTLPLLALLLLLAALLSLWFHPAAASLLWMASLLFSLALSTYTIFQKHRETENARPKILKDAGVMVFTLIMILFFGGVAAMLANYQVGMRWGEGAGLLSALGAGFLVGYLVRKGLLRLGG